MMQRRVSKKHTMKPQLKSSPAARELIQRFEPYRELAAQGSDGRWRVGFGHRAAAREGVRVSRDDAALLLIYDVMQAEAVVDEMFPEPLPKLQRDALTSFVHDVGAAAFRSSDVARYLYECRVEAAAEALAGYGEGSAERREAESAMLLAGRDGAHAGSSPVRKPALVDLVIKVEHPVDPAANAGPAIRPRAALPESIMPPPAPSPQAIARREAENEIARILATVGALPLDDESPQPGTPAAAPAVEAEPEPVAEPAPAGEARAEAAPVDEAASGEPVDEIEPVAEPEAELAAQTEVEAEPARAPDEPEQPAQDTAQPELVSSQVMARMSQEIAQVQPVAPGGANGSPQRSDDDNILPDGVSLGYAFTRVWPVDPGARGEAAPAPDDAAPEVEPETVTDAATDAESDAGPDSAPPEYVQAAVSDVDAAVQATPEAAPVDTVFAAVTVVERTLVMTGERVLPPHPADEPAPSEGAVGEIAGEGEGTTPDADHAAHIDELAGTPDDVLAESNDADPFSPHDLVGNADLFVDSKPVEVRKDDDGWGFVVTLIAGLVVMGAGILDIYGDWPRVWVERDPTWGLMAAVAGGFLVVTATWMLASVLSAKRRQKRSK